MSPFVRLSLSLLIACSFVIIVFLLLGGDFEEWQVASLDIFKDNKPGYVIVSTIVLALDIFLPVPSSVVMYMNGYMLPMGWAIVTTLSGMLLGAGIGYVFCRYMGRLSKRDVDPGALTLVGKYGPVVILFTRGIPVLSEAVSLVCAYNRISFSSYILWHFLGGVPVAAIYAFCGWYAYESPSFLMSFILCQIFCALCWGIGRGIMKSQSPGRFPGTRGNRAA